MSAADGNIERVELDADRYREELLVLVDAFEYELCDECGNDIDRGHTRDLLTVTVRAGSGKRAAWDKDGTHPHFRVMFRCEERTYTIDFWGGSASTVESEQAAAHTIVECVDNDANAGRESFADFCSDYGYNEDSRQAHRTWAQCKRVADRWERLLGGRTLARDESGELIPDPHGVALD